nr:pentapeptide repeat-containing protein [Pleurocapsa sp. PCC 7327]
MEVLKKYVQWSGLVLLKADLQEADLTGTILTDADLRGAIMPDGTVHD